jgi:mono/diheme cytochrome c family protein
MMYRNTTGSGLRWAAAFGLGILFSALAGASGASAQATQQQAPTRDPYQRSVDIYRYETAGKSGPARGEAIYYFKCWICHNQLTTTGGPHLKGLFGRPTLASSGQPVNDQTVREKIRSGGPRMPKFEATLTDADLADLISYLKDSKCCFEGQEPPPNPRYRAK